MICISNEVTAWAKMCYDFIFIIVFNFWHEFIDSFSGYDKDFIIIKRRVQIIFYILFCKNDFQDSEVKEILVAV